MAWWNKKNSAASPTPSIVVAAVSNERPRSVQMSRARRVTESSVQADIRRFDSDGPGVVGQYLDSRSFLVRQAPNEWTYRGEPITDATHPMLHALVERVMREYRSRSTPAEGLFYEHARALSAVAECVIGVTDDGWRVVQTPGLDKNGQGFFADDGKTVVPFVRSARSFCPDLASGKPGKVSSPLFRAVRDIRRYNAVIAAQTGPFLRGSVGNKILNAPDQVRAGYASETEQVTRRDTLISDLADFADRQIKTSDEYMAPFTRIGELLPSVWTGEQPFSVTDIGGQVDPSSQWAERAALEAFARSVGCPIKLIVEGPGTGKFANDDSMMRAYLWQDIQPLCDIVTCDVWAIAFEPALRGALLEARRKGGSSSLLAELGRYDIDGIRWRKSAIGLMEPPDKVAQIAEAVRLGAVPPRVLAQATQQEELGLPDGMTDYEHWLNVVGRPAGEMATEQAYPVPPEIAAASASPAIMTSVTVAAAATKLRPTRVGERLATIERDAAVALSEFLATEAVEVARRAAAAVMRSLPAKDPMRAKLRGENPDVILRAAFNLGIDLTPFLVAAVEPVTVDVSDMVAAVEDTTGVAPHADTIAAAAAAGGLLLAWITAQAKASGPLSPPSGRSLLPVLAGAEVNPATGLPVVDIDGRYARADQQKWVGGQSPATSGDVIQAVTATGVRVSWVWRTNMTGATSDRHPWHNNLDGVTTPTGEGIDGFYPQDHLGCDCFVLPVFTYDEEEEEGLG